MKTKFPLYIPSKGRYDIRKTSDYLTLMNIEHFIIIEEQEFELYYNNTKNNKFVNLLVLPIEYKLNYELCDNIGLTKSTGPGPARNFAWQHSIDNGYEWHWVMDDNIDSFQRLNNNVKIKVLCSAFFICMEEFCLRYKNIGMAGPNYQFFAKQNQKLPPFITNTRIYSCNLIRNDLKYRWRGRYNEDTILSLDMLTDGWCTVQFNAMLQDKATTQTVKGGNNADFYSVEGTLPKSEMLKNIYPEYTKVVFKFNRWHHYVDYRPFKKNKLIRKDGIEIPDCINNFGMVLKEK